MLNWCENRYCGMDDYYMYFFVNGFYRAVKNKCVITITNIEEDVHNFSEEAKKSGGANPYEC